MNLSRQNTEECLKLEDNIEISYTDEVRFTDVIQKRNLCRLWERLVF